MDITRAIAAMKAKPDFTEKVGMVLVHNGVVRAWSRTDTRLVIGLEVSPDQEKIEAIREELLRRPGIFDIIVEAKSGRFRPGDDLLFLIVAGDIRENVKPVLSELLDRIKGEAITKKEIMQAPTDTASSS
ncbi:MAG: molybdenum cofactor biosynthesis protein MoaE [Deltaproteobacteria bacterium]|jgi:molybdopterin synthase catalytic subunit